VWNPAITWTKKFAVFVTLENDNGDVGVGECWCFDTSPDLLVAYLQTEIIPALKDATADQYAQIHQRLLSRATLTARHGLFASAWSGVNIALWDLRSREAMLPLWRFIAQQNPTGTKQSDLPNADVLNGEVKLYASGGLYGKDKSVNDLVNELHGMRAAGFDIVKMKIGGLSIEQDLERVHAVLNGIDDTCRLIIDGVYSYTTDQALRFFKALPADRIEAFQSPVKADQLDSMKTLTDAGLPVMATEAEYRVEIHQQMIQTEAVKYLQTAPVACGGIDRLLQLSQLLDNSNTKIQLSLEVSSTAIALLAACHFAAASHQVAHVEFHYLHQVFFENLGLPSMKDTNGWLKLPEQAGLGMTLPESATHVEFFQM